MVDLLQKWQCVPVAFSRATGVDFDKIIEAIGHDGSEIVTSEPEPYCRKGFHIQELIEALWNLGWAIVEFDAVLSPEFNGQSRGVLVRDILPFMLNQPGVVTGYFNQKPHAESWDGKKLNFVGVVDMLSFYAVIRRN